LKSDTVSDLSLGALDDLASSSAEVQAEVERRIAAGEIVSAAGLQADQLFLHRAAEETISPTQEVILAGCEVSMKRSLVKLPSTSAKPSAATVTLHTCIHATFFIGSIPVLRRQYCSLAGRRAYFEDDRRNADHSDIRLP
jgi:hypothetical protein